MRKHNGRKLIYWYLAKILFKRNRLISLFYYNLNKDFLDFLDKLGRQTNIPLRQNVEKLFKQFDRERKERLKRAYEKPTAPERPNVRKRTMDDVIAERIRQKEAEKANNEFDFF